MYQQNQQNQQNMFNPQQQNQQQAQSSGQLEEKDWLNTILCDLKRCSREYTTAVTESSNQSVRQVFTDLLNSTLALQGQLYQLMKQQNMYKAGATAQAQEIQKQIQSHQQSGQQAFQFAQQALSKQKNVNQNFATAEESLSYQNMANNNRSGQQPVYM